MHPIDARAFHDEVPVVDLHADTPKLMDKVGFDLGAAHTRRPPGPLNLVGHFDLPRARDAGLSGQIFGLWTFPYPNRGCAAAVDSQLDALERAAQQFPEQMVLARTADDIRSAQAGGRLAALTGIEGGHALEGKLENVAHFAARGVRYIGLLHFSPNAIGWPSFGYGLRPDRGLTAFGREVVREMNRCGVIVDLAHVNRRGFFDALEESTAPVMVSHTGVAGVHDTWRNIDDEQIRAVASRGGCVGIIFATMHVGGPDLDSVCDHILHIIDVAGEDVAALGSDFDGLVVPAVGLEDVRGLPRLTAALARRGVRQSTLRKILGENALRVLAAVPPNPKP
jgi:membrane dipeptidase